MGEAKRRGTFKERKDMAEAKKAAEQPARPRGKSRAGLIIAAALAMSELGTVLNGGTNGKR